MEKKTIMSQQKCVHSAPNTSELNSQRETPPFKHGAEKIPQEHFLLVVDDTGKLSTQSLAEKVGLHPGTLHQDLLIMEHLQENNVL